MLIFGCNQKDSIELNYSGYNKNENSSNYNTSEKIETNFESYIDSIVWIVNAGECELSDFKKLRVTVAFEERLKIWSYDENSGGTRGIVHNPIIEFIGNDKHYVVNMSIKIRCEFHEIHELDFIEGIYLLLGSEKEDGACVEQIAYVIKLNGGNKIDLEYPAFGGRPYLSLCNGQFIYDENELIYKMSKGFSCENLNEVLRYQSRYGKLHSDDSSARIIYDEIQNDYYNKGRFLLTFENSVFIN